MVLPYGTVFLSRHMHGAAFAKREFAQSRWPEDAIDDVDNSVLRLNVGLNNQCAVDLDAVANLRAERVPLGFGWELENLFANWCSLLNLFLQFGAAQLEWHNVVAHKQVELINVRHQIEARALLQRIKHEIMGRKERQRSIALQCIFQTCRVEQHL